MAYTIPDATRQQWKKQAQAASMAYSTIVGQHVYDMQGLVEVLDQQLAQATKDLNGTAPNTPGFEEATKKVKELRVKLDQSNQKLAAYRLEQKQNETGTASN